MVTGDSRADIAKALKRSKAVADFLPPPEELVAREPRVKVTIALNAKSINFFKKHAKENNTKYQVMINEVLNRYVEKYEASV